MRQTPTSAASKPASSYLQRAQLPPEPPGRASKEINSRSSPRQAEENRARQLRTPVSNGSNQPRAEENARQTPNYFPSKRPSSINTPHEQNDQYKSRGIGLTSKMGRPASGAKLRDSEDRTNTRNNDYAAMNRDESGNKHGLVGSSSHGRLLEKYRVNSGGGVSTPTNFDQRKLVKEQYGYSKELSEYQKLHEKLNSLENKIADMKSNLEKKRVEKQTILEKQQRDRKLREAERNSKERPAASGSDSPKYKRHAPTELTKEVLVTNQKEEKEKQKPSRTKDSKESKETIPKPETALKGIVTQVPKQNKELHSLNFNPYSPRHNLYYVSEVTRAYKDDKSLVKEHLLSSMHILRIMESIRRATNQEMADKMVTLPRKDIYKDKKTVVFDLDETLIHCNESTSIPHDVKLPITFPTGEIVEAGINIRPHAVDLLKTLSKNFEIIVFTASHSCYANVVLDHLDPHGEYIQHRLYREHCYATAEGMYVKDLRVLNRNLSDMVLVDNAAYSYAFQLDNGIPIIPYYEGRNDFELKALQTYLESMLWAKDVRDINRNTFKLGKYRDYDDPDVLVKELYGEWIV